MSLLSRYPPRDPAPGSLTERPSFSSIYQSSVGWVWNRLRRQGIPERDCDDLTHEVFSAVLSRLPEYDHRNKLRGWLASITYHVAMRYLARHQNRRATLMDPFESDGQVDPAPSSEARIIERRRALDLLDALEPDRFIVFVLYELQGVKMEDMARELGIPLETARTRLRLAKRDLEKAGLRIDARDRSAALGLGALGLLPLDLDGLLDAGRELPMPDGVQEDLWKRLRSTHGPAALEAGAGTSGALVAGSLGVATRLAGGLAVKIAAGGVAAFLLGFGVRGLVDDRVHPSAPPVAIATIAAPTAELVTAASAPSANAAPVTLVASPPSAASAAGAISSAKSAIVVPGAAEGASLAGDDAEGDLIKRARAALFAGNAGEALRVLDRHARQFPRGSMGAEREVIAIQALLQAGRRAEAAQRADDFRKRSPKSPFLSTLDAVLAPPPVTP